MKKHLSNILSGLIIISFSCLLQAGEISDHSGHENQHREESALENHQGEREERGVHLSKEQQKLAGIITEKLSLKAAPIIIEAPGEILLDSYSTSKVTPRIPAQIIQRHAKLGDLVLKGAPLITLSSVEMSKSQGQLLIAGLEWKRAKKLGRKVVSDKRYLQAKITLQQASARARAYGMTDEQIKAFLKKSDADSADGTFQLLAPQAGTVIEDDFILGEQVEVGDILYVITDESKRWIEARLAHEQADLIKVGADASIQVEHHKIAGKVIQIRHTLDKITRRHGVRVSIPNPEDHLHPGLFVTTLIEGGRQIDQLLVVNDAILKAADGDWILFVEHEENEFEAQEVEVLYQIGDQSVISGIPVGTVVVTQGAFFIQSELAKSGFEIHNH